MRRVAVKHYLRGEETIYYEDLHPLVKFLPIYILPHVLPSMSRGEAAQAEVDADAEADDKVVSSCASSTNLGHATPAQDSVEAVSGTPNLASPTQGDSSQRRRKSHVPPPLQTASSTPPDLSRSATVRSRTIQVQGHDFDLEKGTTPRDNAEPPPTARTYNSLGGTLHRTTTLLPSHNPPRYALFDVFPLSLLVGFLAKRGKTVKGKTSARVKAQAGLNHNIPLEITFYLVRCTTVLFI